MKVETVAQFGVIFLLFALGLEFSAAKVTFNVEHLMLHFWLIGRDNLQTRFIVAASCSPCSGCTRRSASDCLVHLFVWSNCLGMFVVYGLTNLREKYSAFFS